MFTIAQLERILQLISPRKEYSYNVQMFAMYRRGIRDLRDMPQFKDTVQRLNALDQKADRVWSSLNY